MMKYGVVLPGGSATEQIEQAILAEHYGWDAVFVWEAAYGVDPWTLLGAVASSTNRIQLGTMLTPLPWRRPWKVASQVATLDQISGGRAILTVGVGATSTDLPSTGEVTGLRQRAEMLDEGIDLIRGLWNGATSYHGQHYHYECDREDLWLATKPAQERIPIWTVAVWPRLKSMRRALRCDGVVPQYQATEPTPADARELRKWLHKHGKSIDVITEGETPADDAEAARAQVEPWHEAGCTWWLETRWSSKDQIRPRITAGPPRLPEA